MATIDINNPHVQEACYAIVQAVVRANREELEAVFRPNAQRVRFSE